MKPDLDKLSLVLYIVGSLFFLAGSLLTFYSKYLR